MVWPVAGRHVDLRGQDGALAPPATLGQPVSDDAFGDAVALPVVGPVDVGRVKKVDALLERTVHNGVSNCLGGFCPEIQCAETKSAYCKPTTAQLGVLHLWDPFC